MGEFLAVALGFPTVLFSFLLVVVVGYWLLVMIGGLDVDLLDGADADASDAGEGGFAGVLGGIGLGGVPATVVISLLIAFAWFVSLAGTVLIDGAGRSALAFAVLVAALAGAWLGTRLLVLPLRRMLPGGPEPSRSDFVGRVCVVRTGRVDATFGQAEVTSADGSTAIVQVRQAGDDPLRAGDAALIYDFDADGEFFWVVPADAALRADPRENDPRTNGQRES